jgi:hypothetical protein
MPEGRDDLVTARSATTVAVLALGVGAPAAHATVAVPFQRGITVGEWGATAYEPAHTTALMKTLASRYHVDTVTLFVVWEQANARASVVAPGYRTARTVNLVKAIRAARAAGLRVVLRTYVDLANGGWRGDVVPASPSTWFASYTRFVLHYAELAQREHVSGLVFASEMAKLSSREDDWYALVAQVRRHFTGFVAYDANWDEATHVAWWDAVDVISISAYYPVATQPGQPVDTLVAGWQRWFAEIDVMHQLNDKPVMFGEIGYRTVTTAAVQPWLTAPAPFSLAAQRDAYEAALRVWYRVPWFAGFDWWYVPPQRALLAGRRGADHQPTAASLQLMGRWYARPRGAPQ